jgi:hypothetical protein
LPLLVLLLLVVAARAACIHGWLGSERFSGGQSLSALKKAPTSRVGGYGKRQAVEQGQGIT